MGVAHYNKVVYIRYVKNRSGSKSVQVIEKRSGKYTVVRTFGSTKDPEVLNKLNKQAQQFINNPNGTKQSILPGIDNNEIKSAVNDLTTAVDKLSVKIRTVGPEFILGTLFDEMGFGVIKEALFRHLVISRLVFPLSKLKTVDYLRRYQGVDMSVKTVYRFLDRLNEKYKAVVKNIVYNHTKRVGGSLTVVFYDLTTLYFETETEDDLRKIGLSKDGKFQHPQIMFGLLVGENGLPIGYDTFPGNTYEGSTLISFLEKVQTDYPDIGKPTVIADAGLLNKDNLQKLKDKDYQYIISARIKNENQSIKNQILQSVKQEKTYRVINKSDHRLIISYTDKRAKKDEYNRQRGLTRLKTSLKSGKLTKKHINNRGYNKFLELDGKIDIKLNEEKIEADKRWDGLKGYVTNTKLPPKVVINQYNQLWHIEKAFRISKTDLRIRPIYHHLERRIKSHICIAFVSYAIYKELERILAPHNISAKRALELMQTWYALEYTDLNQTPEYIMVDLDDDQKLIHRIICQDGNKNE